METRFKYNVVFCLALLGLASCQPLVESTLPAPSEIPLPFQASTTVAPLPSATIGDVVADPLLGLSFSEEDPVTNSEEILRILDELQRRELDWFSRPGWYYLSIYYPVIRDYTRTWFILTHVINEYLECLEQLYYFKYEGEILPYTIRTADGITGTINPPLDGKFNDNLFYETSPACTLTSNWILDFDESYDDDFIIHDEAAGLRENLEGDISGIVYHASAWTELMENRPTFVLVSESKIEDPTLRGYYVNPETDMFASIARSLKFKYIDMETGLLVREAEEFYADDGQRITASHQDEEWGSWYMYEFFESLPASLAQAYEATDEALRNYLEHGNSN